MVKMIICDMDGTLLNSNKKLSEENHKAISYAKEKNIHVLLATGRIFTSARIFAKKLNLNTPIIACNGALIQNYVSGMKYYEKSIEKNLYPLILKILEENDVHYYLYTDKDFYAKELKHSALSYWENNNNLKDDEKIDIKLIENINFISDSDLKILKFIIIDDSHDKLNNIKKELLDVEGIEISQSWSNNIEIMSKSVSKGNAVKVISEKYNIDVKNIMAIGDHMNDISMIKTVGYGIAMGNAESEVKKIAYDVTDSNDKNGVARAIYKYV